LFVLRFTNSDYPPLVSSDFFHSGITSKCYNKKLHQCIHHSNSHIFESSNEINLKKKHFINLPRDEPSPIKMMASCDMENELSRINTLSYLGILLKLFIGQYYHMHVFYKLIMLNFRYSIGQILVVIGIL
jgi:hypothetical protein